MADRRSFLKNGILASLALAIPVKSEESINRLVVPLITGDGDMRIGVNGQERMRIYSNGSVGMACVNPSYELKIK